MEISTVYCFNCRKPDNLAEAEYCSNCGFYLNSNFCTNDLCDYNNGSKVSLTETDCYCDSCGSETTYFQEGLIKPKVYEERSFD